MSATCTVVWREGAFGLGGPSLWVARNEPGSGMWTLCEPTTLQSFSRYRVDMKGQEMGSPVSGVFQMWNNSKSPIRYLWGKISDCHIIEVEPGTGVIGTLGTAGGVVTCWLRKKSSELKGLVQGS